GRTVRGLVGLRHPVQHQYRQPAPGDRAESVARPDHHHRDGLAWSANPLGATLGGVIVERSGDVQTVYAAIGALVFGIALYFRLFSPLGHAERYLETPARAAAV